MIMKHKQEENVQRNRGEDKQSDRKRDLTSNQGRWRHVALKDLNDLKKGIKMSFF